MTPKLLSDAERKAMREKWEDDNYSKLICCPLHPKAHWAILYEWGHQHGGYYECPRGDFEEHEHDDYQIETFEVDDSHPDRSDGYSYEGYVCGICGTPIDLDVASPAQDRAEAEADRQIDEYRERDL